MQELNLDHFNVGLTAKDMGHHGKEDIFCKDSLNAFETFGNVSKFIG